MANPISPCFLGEIRIMSFMFAPRGWATCNGQKLPINQYQELFKLFGTTYGGDGKITFALPDLQALAPAHVGAGISMGAVVGEINHVLTLDELAPHNHSMSASATGALRNATGRNPAGNVPAGAVAATNPITPVQIWGTGPTGPQFATGMIGPTGGNSAHENRQPFLALNFCVALVGYPP
jgi:microcystin-dependent protein